MYDYPCREELYKTPMGRGAEEHPPFIVHASDKLPGIKIATVTLLRDGLHRAAPPIFFRNPGLLQLLAGHSSPPR